MRLLLRKILIFILKVEAKLVLRKYKPRIVTITGSVGKTSTKDAVYTVLSNFFFVRKNKRNVSNEIDIPLTVLGCPTSESLIAWLKNIFQGFTLLFFKREYPDWLVLELMVRKPGDMKKIISWIYSDIVMVTHFGPAPPHIEFFKSREQLIGEKSSLIKTLKEDGLLIVNADDPSTLELRDKTKQKSFSFGFNEIATIVISNLDIIYKDSLPQGTSFRINYEGNSLPILMEGMLGINHAYASAGALLVAYSQNLNMVEAANSLKKYKAPPGRMKLIEGMKETLIIDDSFNSSPAACEEALRVLKEIEIPGRKFAVFGDMLELGKHTDEAHRKIGGLAAESAHILMTVGIRARMITSGAQAGGMSEINIFQFEDARQAGKHIKSVVEKGDIILVKGSQAMRMEHIVEEVMAHPKKKTKLLARQSPEWQAN